MIHFKEIKVEKYMFHLNTGYTTDMSLNIKKGFISKFNVYLVNEPKIHSSIYFHTCYLPCLEYSLVCCLDVTSFAKN